MNYLGDFAEGHPVNFMWNTSGATGASITRAADGTISVYKDNSDGSSYDQTQSTIGITNDEDVDGLTGVHSCCIYTFDNAWYEPGHDYSVVLSAATIDGETVNAVIAEFSIENRFMRGTDSAATATSLATHDGKMDTLTTQVGTAGAGLSDLGGMSTTMKGQVNTEVDGALNTAIPGSPVSNSINERVAAMDALTEASGDGDLAAIKTATDRLTAVRAAVLTDLIDGGRLDLLIDAILEDTGTTLPASLATHDGKLDTVDGIVDAILADTAVIGAAGVGLTSVRLSSAGLDSIATTEPSGVASTFREMIVQTWRRFTNKSTLTATQLKTYKDDDTTAATTQAVSNDGTTQTVGKAT